MSDCNRDDSYVDVECVHQDEINEGNKSLSINTSSPNIPRVIEDTINIISSSPPLEKVLAHNKRPMTNPRHAVPMLCLVCTDKASGYHYGVPSCEGCKAFFKRSLQLKQLNYKCPASNNCTINKMSRKCCQACRLGKCHAVGMSKECKKVKKRDIRDTKSKNYPRLENPDECIESVLTPLEIEHENIIEQLRLTHSKLYLGLDETVNGTLTHKFYGTIGKQLIHIIDWAKRIPGYSSLILSDQAVLLQATWVELMVANWLFLSLTSTNALKLSHTFDITKQDATELGFGLIYDQFLALVHRTKGYKLDEEEISCFKAIILTNAETIQLSRPAKVHALSNQFCSSLQYYTKNRHKENPLKFAKIVLILPQLKCLVNEILKVLHALNSMSEKGAYLSDLVVEMLDVKNRQ